MKGRMTRKLTNSAAASLLLLLSTALSALAGSVTQPGDTMGSASGAPIPPGVYFGNQASYGCSNTTPRTCTVVDVPIVAWSTPWTIFGGRLQFATAPTTGLNVNIHDEHHASGLFNPWVGGQLAWDLGHGWGFSYLLGAYIDVNTSVSYSSASLNQRFALSYTANEWNLTADVIWGTNFDQATSKPQGFPCPASMGFGCNPNFVNVDLTATKRFGKWELGPIGFYSTDISTPFPGYLRQSKAAVGGLVGYFFGPVILQMYVTTEVYEKNYGGRDTRLWSRVVIPLGNAPPPGLRPIAY
jgi:Putative MetA-pathway of phenol degradation